MEIDIKATALEKKLVIRAIRRLNNIKHLNYMSQAMIAEDSGVKPSKVRIALQDLIDAKCIEQIRTNDGKRVSRYHYALTNIGNKEYPHENEQVLKYSNEKEKA